MSKDNARHLLLASLLVCAFTFSSAQDANSEFYPSPFNAENASTSNSIFGTAVKAEDSGPLSSAALFGIPSYLQATKDSADNVAVQWNLVSLKS